jgi:hypothetical protein
LITKKIADMTGTIYGNRLPGGKQWKQFGNYCFIAKKKKKNCSRSNWIKTKWEKNK